MFTCVWVILNRKKCLHFIFGKVQRSNPVKKWYVTPTCCGLRSRSYGRPLSHILFCALLFLWSAHKTINISGDCRLWGRSWSYGRFINNDCQRRLLIVCVCAVAHVCVRVGVCCVVFVRQVTTACVHERQPHEFSQFSFSKLAVAVLVVVVASVWYAATMRRFKHVRINCQNFMYNAY